MNYEDDSESCGESCDAYIELLIAALPASPDPSCVVAAAIELICVTFAHMDNIAATDIARYAQCRKDVSRPILAAIKQICDAHDHRNDNDIDENGGN